MSASDTISVYLNRVAEISSLEGVAACDGVRPRTVSMARCCAQQNHRKKVNIYSE